MRTDTFICDDGYRLFYRVWEAERPSAVLHILHGMAEHSERYDAFASFLAQRGYTVYCQDHRGHGHTAADNNDPFGCFSPSDGWNRVIEDACQLSRMIAQKHDGLPLFLMGHSMGSFMARCVMTRQPDLYFGVIVMGSAGSAGLKGKVGRMIATLRLKRYGYDHVDEKLARMSFAGFNRQVENPESENAWLSRDSETVKRYDKDPHCGFVCTTSFYRDLIDAVSEANNKKLARKIPCDLPVLVISGEADPVGDYGKGVRQVYELYRNSGISDLKLVLIPDFRHEILNECEYQRVFRYLVKWMDERI